MTSLQQSFQKDTQGKIQGHKRGSVIKMLSIPPLSGSMSLQYAQSKPWAGV